jgi:hypothetical protein
MMQAKIALRGFWQAAPVRQRGFKEHIRADDVGLDEIGRAVD